MGDQPTHLDGEVGLREDERGRQESGLRADGIEAATAGEPS